MPRRSIWKGCFVDAFLLRMKKKREIEYARNPIGEPGHAFVNCNVMDFRWKRKHEQGLTNVYVGQQFGEFASTRKRRLSRTNIGPGRGGKKSSLSAYGTKRKSDFGKTRSES
ncbi:ribosomal protein S19 (mitochondrion) [Acer yangbiense]|uniref:Ribosomal protein S19 n=1 Tax=Acer yangbiense TaxID=1000413 RepID=A0ABQ7FR19_9ROSI|nr:ribosomal protein S19 [Acer yangbiense]KAF4609389.1 ribosomal protein S19 [Acer yangbiense]